MRASLGPLRQEIVRRRQQGIPLTQIAVDLAIPYGTVRNIWRLYGRHDRDGLAPDYRSCGRPVPPRIQELLRIACDLKREHPAWGAGLIRLQLRNHARREASPRSEVSNSPSSEPESIGRGAAVAAAVVVPQAVEPHEIWQVDAVENVPLATGQRIRWLKVTDEASGAMLATEVSPPRRWEHVRARDPGDVPPRLRPLGPARPRARRQRLSLGLVPRPALRAGVVVNRAGGRTDLEPAGPAHAQSQSGAVQRPDPAVGRAAHLHRLQTGGSRCWTGWAASNERSTLRSGSDPLGGVPATAHAAAWVSAGPREGDVGSLPSGRLLSPGLLEAACRSQWSDLDLRARPSGRLGHGLDRNCWCVRRVITVLVRLIPLAVDGQPAVVEERTRGGINARLSARGKK